MLKWISRIVVVGIVGYIGLLVYEYNRRGLFSMPDLPKGAYFVSFKNGLRGIVLDADVPESSTGDGPKFFRSLSFENREKKYLGITSDVPSWFADAWSICQAPTEQERVGIIESLPDNLHRSLGNARFEAVCRIDVDGEPLLRGLVFSVPRL
ncbi:MAG: hypothetical protein ACK5M4_13315 [Pseudorhodobacter sp.]